MVEDDLKENFNKYVRLPPSIPFLWEEKPGFPKKDWNPEISGSTGSTTVSSSSSLLIPPAPVKLVASVPFLWEEKPGKPLPFLTYPILESTTSLSFAEPLSWLLPLIHTTSNNDKTSEGDYVPDWISELSSERFSSGKGESFSSAPVSENCLISSIAVVNDVPMDQTPSGDSDTNSLSDTDISSTTGSYATGTSCLSLIRPSLLENLFPLLPPRTGFLEKIGYPPEMRTSTPTDINITDFDHENTSNFAARRTPTLGELIMMSRRMSCRRKGVEMSKSNITKEVMKKAFGCFMLGTSSKITGLHWKRNSQLRLKMGKKEN